jgi:hypothetical protein
MRRGKSEGGDVLIFRVMALPRAYGSVTCEILKQGKVPDSGDWGSLAIGIP